RPLAKDNKSLGRFILDGIPPAPRGVPQVEVAFDIDASGLLTVTAKDKATGKSQAIKITGSTGLSKEQIDKMKEEAEKHAKEDQEEKEKIEVKNKAENLIYVSEKSLKDAGDKAPKELKNEIEAKIKELKEVKDKGEKNTIEEKTKALSDTLQKIGQYMYQEQAKDQTEDVNDKKTKDEKNNTKDDKKDVEEGEVVK
ncbi:MAG: Hsp70 family protein, partial [Patescibacteria group bacterium]